MVEGDRLDTSIQFNVKGVTAFPDIVVTGNITVAVAGTASEWFEPRTTDGLQYSVLCINVGPSDIEEFATVPFINSAEIRLFTRQDFINLEYDDRVILIFTPDDPSILSAAEGVGEYIRDTATVNIIDNDSKSLDYI